MLAHNGRGGEGEEEYRVVESTVAAQTWLLIWTSSPREWDVGKIYLNCSSALTIYYSLAFDQSLQGIVIFHGCAECVDNIVPLCL
jgi:hypothetical protein